MPRLQSFAAALLIAVGAPFTAGAQPQVLDFDTGPLGTCGTGATPYQFGGFNFFTPGICVGSWQNNPVSNNGSPGLIYGFNSMTMQQINGNAFTLQSLYAGISWYSQATSFQVDYSLDLVGGGQAIGSFVVGQGLNQYAFGQTVTSATFTGVPDGYIAMDDIAVDADVPEPASLLLLTTGLGGLVAARRRRNNA